MATIRWEGRERGRERRARPSEGEGSGVKLARAGD